MKKLLCFLLCSVLIFSSVSLCFAQDWSATDSQNLQNVAGRLYYMNQSAAYYLYNIATNTNNIYNKCVDIYNALFNNGHNITYWVNNISSYMSPIYTSITSIPNDLWVIQSLLGYPVSEGGGTTWHPYLNELSSALTNNGLTGNFNVQANGHTWLVDTNSNTVRVYTYSPSGTYSSVNEPWFGGSPLGNLAYIVRNMSDNDVINYSSRYTADLTGYNSQQALVSFADPDSTVTFTPLSAIDGLYKYLNALNTPLARLGYTLASDQRIEAQEAAAANEQAVVDNFIDSSGDGVTSPSDIGSVSNLSSGYKQNFGTDASPSGIFDIFNSDHATWFSQETKNQLDTTTPTRLTKGPESETPLLDKQIEDIYNTLGVKQP